MSTDIPLETIEPVEILNFSATKKKILLFIKKQESVDLSTLSQHLNLTKMGVHKHISELEDLGFIERFKNREKKSVGRPKLYLRLGPNSTNIFPRAYTSLSCSFLRYIEEEMGMNGVIKAFERRKEEIFEKYSKKMSSSKFDTRVKQLAKVRNEDGYMVELKVLNGKYELLEYNCPIVAVVDVYNEACQSERKLFHELLSADVEVSHRIASGESVCRFLISHPDYN